MLDHEAIRKAYSTVVSIDDTAGAFDKDGKSVTLEQSKIDTARTELNTEAAKVKYKTDRTTNGSTTYSPVGDQLDLLWHAIDADADLKVKFSAFYNSIKEVKDANPKP
jgi:hypothetical protein